MCWYIGFKLDKILFCTSNAVPINYGADAYASKLQNAKTGHKLWRTIEITFTVQIETIFEMMTF